MPRIRKQAWKKVIEGSCGDSRDDASLEVILEDVLAGYQKGMKPPSPKSQALDHNSQTLNLKLSALSLEPVLRKAM